MKRRIQLGSLIGVLLACGAAWAQQQGPLTPPPKREIPRISTENKPEPPPVPVEEIIRRFVQKEDEFKRALDTYTFHTSVRVQEYAEDGSAIGEAQLLSETYVKSDGQRYARILQEPPPTLKRARFLLVDLQELTATQQFLLTSDQLAKYNLTYAGLQQVDELNTFVFQIKPKQVDRRERRFEGVVWVDDRDFEIVKSYGRFVSEVVSDDPFLMFETYRETVDGKLRLPTFVRSEGKQLLEKGEVRVRLTLRYTEYKPPAPK